jgi:hypothetical protein
MDDPVKEEMVAIIVKICQKQLDTWAARVDFRRRVFLHQYDDEIDDFLDALDKWEKDGWQSGNAAAC